jgi:hypothetical protein
VRVKSAIFVVARIILYGGAALLFVIVLAPSLFSQVKGGTRGKHVREQKNFATIFKSGSSNAPVLAMDWFSQHGVYFCRVKQSGDVFSARDVGYAIQGGTGISSAFSLNSTNRPVLESIINRLPPPPKGSLPIERRILVSGVRSNQWFASTYDRENIPPEVEELYELTGAYLEWFIPVVGSHPDRVTHAMSQNDPNLFVIAQDASLAVSSSTYSGLQIWDVKGHSAIKVAGLEKLPGSWTQYDNRLWGLQTITPDGQIIIFAVQDLFIAMKWKTQEVLWKHDQMRWGNLYHANNRTLAIGNAGKSIFIVESNSIERWNVADGRRVSALVTNDSGIKIMQPSPDGRLLFAAFGDDSFAIWKTEQDEMVFHSAKPDGIDCAAMSPDNQRIVMTSFGSKKLIVYDWQHGRRKEFPLRTPYPSGSAGALFWSPDGTKLAAYIDSDPATVIVYETTLWRPIANWPCGASGSRSLFGFNKAGVLFQMIDGEVNLLEVNRVKAIIE